MDLAAEAEKNLREVRLSVVVRVEELGEVIERDHALFSEELAEKPRLALLDDVVDVRWFAVCVKAKLDWQAGGFIGSHVRELTSVSGGIL